MKPDMSVPQGDAYAKIGVRPFINCCATRTIHGGSVMLPEVREAMRDASGRFVDIDEIEPSGTPADRPGGSDAHARPRICGLEATPRLGPLPIKHDTLGQLRKRGHLG